MNFRISGTWRAGIAVLLLTSIDGVVMADDCPPVDVSLAGQYYYYSNGEVWSEWELRGDGHYLYLERGNINRGCWQSDGAKVTFRDTSVSTDVRMELKTRESSGGTNDEAKMEPIPLTYKDAIGDTIVVALSRGLRGALVTVEYIDGYQNKQAFDGDEGPRMTRPGGVPVKRIGVEVPGATVPQQWFANREPARRFFVILADAESMMNLRQSTVDHYELKVSRPGLLEHETTEGSTIHTAQFWRR